MTELTFPDGNTYKLAPMALTRATARILELMDMPDASPAQLVPAWLDCVESCMRRGGHTPAEIETALESVAITDQEFLGRLSAALMGNGSV